MLFVRSTAIYLFKLKSVHQGVSNRRTINAPLHLTAGIGGARGDKCSSKMHRCTSPPITATRLLIGLTPLHPATILL